MRHPRAPGHLLQLYTHGGGVLSAEAAPIGTDAGLDRAQGLAIGVPRHETGVGKIAPDQWQGFLLDAQQIDALAPGDVHSRYLVLFRDLGDGLEL